MNLSWRIADFTVSVSVQNPERLSPQWQQLFLSYAVAFEDAATSDVFLRITLSPDWNLSVEENLVTFNCADGIRWESVQMSFPGFSGSLQKEVNLQKYVGDFTVLSNGIMGIYRLLNLLLALVVEEKGGLLLHSSGVVRNGRLWLFVGPSGSGKTTIATELVDGGEIFTEDETALLFDDKGTLTAHGTPFGDLDVRADTIGKAKVGGIVFIFQASHNAVSKMSLHETMSTLFHQTCWYNRDEHKMAQFLNAAGKVFDAVPCCRLDFRKEAEFWSLLEKSA